MAAPPLPSHRRMVIHNAAITEPHPWQVRRACSMRPLMARTEAGLPALSVPSRNADSLPFLSLQAAWWEWVLNARGLLFYSLDVGHS